MGSDPAGDAGGGPDILSITAEYDSSNLFLSATFAPGSVDLSEFAFGFALDIDVNPATGFECPVGTIFPCGAEYTVGFFAGNDPDGLADLIDLGAGVEVGQIPFTFEASVLTLIVPLNSVSGLPDDGEVLFGLVAGIPSGEVSFTPSDFAPGSVIEGPLAGPSSPVPVPGTARLSGLGLLVLAAIRRLR